MEAHDLQEELIADLVKTREADLGILREMMEAGLMYGHKKSKTNPKFKPYIFTTRNGVEIIDLDQTLTFLGQAIEFLKNQVKEGKLVLLAAIQPAAREAIKRKILLLFCYSFLP